jgi:hypothetical protein
MNKNISSRAQLKLEIERLTAEKKLKEKQIGGLVKDYTTALKPVNLVKNAFSSITGDSELKGMLKTKGTEAAIGFVVTQLLFRNSNPLIRTAATVLGTTFASSIFGEDSAKYVEKIKNLIHKFRSKKGEIPSDTFNETDIYNR